MKPSMDGYTLWDTTKSCIDIPQGSHLVHVPHASVMLSCMYQPRSPYVLDTECIVTNRVSSVGQ